MSAPLYGPVAACAPGRPTRAERLYRLLLRAYPAAFRAAYEREMTLLFRDQCREAGGDTFHFWMAVLGDVAQSAPALRAEAWRARWDENTQTLGAIMKIAAVLTVLLGVFVGLGAVVDGVGGQQQGFGGAHLLSVVLGGLAGTSLLVAGVVLLRSTTFGRRPATIASLASLVLIVLVQLVFPWMSIFAQLVGYGLPIALLIALHWPRQHGPSAPGVA